MRIESQHPLRDGQHAIPGRVRLGWVLYDIANSSYHLMLPVILMPLYFKSVLSDKTGTSDLAWALVVSVPVLMAGLAGPFLGAFLDLGHSRLRGLMVTAALSILFAMALLLVPSGWYTLGAIVFGCSFLSFTLSLSVYDGLLPLASGRSHMDRLSGLGWGAGYLGGLVVVGLTYPLLRNAQLPQAAAEFRNSTAIVCGFFAITAVISGWLMRGADSVGLEAGSVLIGFGPRIREAAVRVTRTVVSWRLQKPSFLLIGSYYLANDGLATLTYFTSIYATTTLGFSPKDILILFMIVQTVAVPSSIIAGRLAEMFGARRVLITCLVVWVIVIGGYALAATVVEFWCLSVVTGLVIGSTPAVYRSVLAKQVSNDHTAEMFGFNSFASRASAVIGPLLFGVIASLFGSQRFGLVSIAVFFVLAGIVLPKEDADSQAVIGRTI